MGTQLIGWLRFILFVETWSGCMESPTLRHILSFEISVTELLTSDFIRYRRYDKPWQEIELGLPILFFMLLIIIVHIYHAGYLCNLQKNLQYIVRKNRGRLILLYKLRICIHLDTVCLKQFTQKCYLLIQHLNEAWGFLFITWNIFKA